jgi:hypothetical protein
MHSIEERARLKAVQRETKRLRRERRQFAILHASTKVPYFYVI